MRRNWTRWQWNRKNTIRPSFFSFFFLVHAQIGICDKHATHQDSICSEAQLFCLPYRSTQLQESFVIVIATKLHLLVAQGFRSLKQLSVLQRKIYVWIIQTLCCVTQQKFWNSLWRTSSARTGCFATCVHPPREEKKKRALWWWGVRLWEGFKSPKKSPAFVEQNWFATVCARVWVQKLAGVQGSDVFKSSMREKCFFWMKLWHGVVWVYVHTVC
jgi:hypothetical protein